MIGSYLVACCEFRTRTLLRKCRVDILNLADNFANWEAISDLDMESEVTQSTFGMLDGKLFLIGGMSLFPMCS